MGLIILRTHSKLLLKSLGKNKLVFIAHIISNLFNRQTGADQKTGCFMHLIINEEGLCGHSKLFLKGIVQIGTAYSEKVLFAADELTGLIWAAALMRPSKSTKDMELKSLKKKYKSKGFAAGCSREVIERGAEQLGWELQKLLTMTLQAMADCEDEIKAEMDAEE